MQIFLISPCLYLFFPSLWVPFCFWVICDGQEMSENNLTQHKFPLYVIKYQFILFPVSFLVHIHSQKISVHLQDSYSHVFFLSQTSKYTKGFALWNHPSHTPPVHSHKERILFSAWYIPVLLFTLPPSPIHIHSFSISLCFALFFLSFFLQPNMPVINTWNQGRRPRWRECFG